MIKLCHIDDIPEDSSKGFEYNDHSLFAVKKDGQLFIYKNSCPHLGVELNWQEDQFLDIDNTLIQCSTHGALFIIEDGQCVAGPCLGEQLQTISYTIEDGMVTVSSL
ncbi:Rieske (2Fe-2S) protein [Dasania marina]|uniref:Rieske (2Fe-2S) protein n=1 Tax=Dasania marina TaxID=471499 RepID=UPI00036ADC38|nr:Rieske (2Fe-2S) protein [Dasania marina]